MSQPDSTSEPVFAEAWHAHAFALANTLTQLGHFSQEEWTAALARELKNAGHRGELDDGSRYYDHWLAALEKLVAAKGLVDTRALLARKAAWEQAYRRTPHGKPVELTNL